MIKMSYLNEDKCAIRRFALKVDDPNENEKERTEAELQVILGAAKGVIKDTLNKLRGELMNELELSARSVFMVVSFEDELNMETWNSLVGTLVKGANLYDVISSKVLWIKGNKGDARKIREKIEKIRKTLLNYKAAVYTEKKLTNEEYKLTIFFTDEELMKKWEETTFNTQK